MPCNCVELTGNKRPWIRWTQVGVHVRGLVVCPIVCGENRQMNNQPAVSLEYQQQFIIICFISFSSWTNKMLISFFPCLLLLKVHSRYKIFTLFPDVIDCMFTLNVLCSSTTVVIIHIEPLLSPPFSFSTPSSYPLFNPCILSPPFSPVPIRQYEKVYDNHYSNHLSLSEYPHFSSV